MKSDELISRITNLQSLLVDFMGIERQIFVPDRGRVDRLENDVEHSYNLAMIAWYLSQHYPQIDSNKVIKYSLVHDLVEVHAGDSQAIGRTPEQEEAKDKAEQAAQAKLASDWSDFGEMNQFLADYEDQIDTEAKFVKALDKLTPTLLNLLSGGKTWKRYDFKAEQIKANKDEKTKYSPEVFELWSSLRNVIDSHPEYFNPTS